eukprot:1157254-Pelagomonas_calceolata.AAC.5
MEDSSETYEDCRRKGQRGNYIVAVLTILGFRLKAECKQTRFLGAKSSLTTGVCVCQTSNSWESKIITLEQDLCDYIFEDRSQQQIPKEKSLVSEVPVFILSILSAFFTYRFARWLTRQGQDEDE